MYILQTAGLLVAVRRGHIPSAEAGTFDLGRLRVPIYVLALTIFVGVAVALIFLPQFAGNGWVFLGTVVLAVLWWATGLRTRLSRGDAGTGFATNNFK